MQYTELVSIIVPVYNTGLYLKECLDSLCGQSYRNLEIICINDGSTDNSGDILEKYAVQDPRIVIIERTKPSGSGALPRNLGIKRSKGDYLAFVDSDDYLDARFVETLLTGAKKNDADLVLCSNYRVDEDDRILEVDTELHFEYFNDKLAAFSSSDMPDRIFQISNAAVWHRLFKKEFVDKNQLYFQENTPSMDDIFFVNATLVAAEKIYIMNDRLIYYRDGRRGSQTSQIERHYESVYMAFSELIHWMKSRDNYEPFKVSLNNWILATMMWWYTNIREKEISERVFYLYKNEYFPKLGLSMMTLDQILPLYEGFFIDIMLNKYHPPLGVVLGLISDKRVVVFGAGKHGRKVIREIEEYGKADIVLWCDSNYSMMGDERIVSPASISDVAFDNILIAIRSRKAVDEIKEYITKQLRISEDVIYLV